MKYSENIENSNDLKTVTKHEMSLLVHGSHFLKSEHRDT